MRRGRTVEASKSRSQRYSFMRGMNDFDGFGMKATEAGTVTARARVPAMIASNPLVSGTLAPPTSSA